MASSIVASASSSSSSRGSGWAAGAKLELEDEEEIMALTGCRRRDRRGGRSVQLVEAEGGYTDDVMVGDGEAGRNDGSKE